MTTMTRRAFAALAGTTVLGFVGCATPPGTPQDGATSGGTSSLTDAGSGVGSVSLPVESVEPVETEPEPLEIAESGFYVDTSNDINYVVGIYNPNSDVRATNITISATGRAEDGSILFSDGSGWTSAYPGGTGYSCSSAGNGVAPAKVEFAVQSCSWEPAQPLAEGDLTVSNVSELVDSFDDPYYTGEVTRNVEGFDSVSVTILLRDEEGKIVYGTRDVVDVPMPGVAVPFEIDALFWTEVPPHASFEAKVQPN